MKTKVIEKQILTVNRIEAIKAGGIGLLSFLFGGASLLGSICPFVVAFVAGVPTKQVITAAIGSILGLVLFGQSGFVLYGIFGILIATATRICFAKLVRKRLQPITLAITAFFSMLIVTIIRAVTITPDFSDFMLMATELILTGCFAYFYAISSNALLRRRSNPILSYIQLTSIAVFAITGICAVAHYSVFKVNIGVILAVLAIFIATNRNGVVGAAIVSILAGISLTLYSPTMLELSGILVIAGFIGGVFSPLGKLFQFSSFIIVSCFCTLLLGAPVSLVYSVIAIFISAAVFVLTPQKLLSRLEVTSDKESISGRIMPQSAAAKLQFASNAMDDLKNELLSISSKFTAIDYNNVGSIYDVAANTVCKGCSRALDCWDNNYNDIMDAFNPVTERLKTMGKIEESGMPKYFLERCCKLTPLIKVINEYYAAFLAKQNNKRELGEARKIVFEQFSSLSEMLYEIGSELDDISGYDEAMSRRVLSVFCRLESEPDRLIASIDSDGRATIEIYTTSTIKNSRNTLCEAISNAADRIFDLPQITVISNQTKISLFETANFEADFSFEQVCCGDNTVCGDSFESFVDSKGYAYFMLSDGMGNGSRAAIDSVMTCSIMSKLLKVGFGIESALKMINSSLLVKSTDESLSTIDMLKLDLYTGEAEIYKAGAVTTFAIIKGELSRIEANALPIGIIQPAQCATTHIKLNADDIILIVSDGATANGEGFIADTLKRCSKKSAGEIASIICNEAKAKEQDKHDDITVAAIKIKKVY